MKPIWVVDDDDSIRWVLEKALARSQLESLSFSNPNEVVEALKTATPSVLVSDIRMHGSSGLDLLRIVKEEYPSIPVIIMTAFSDLDSAVASFKGGAFEYLAKPFDLSKAVALIRRALEENQHELVAESIVDEAPEMLGHSAAMQDIFRGIGRLTNSSVTVLVTGESGAGKELVARALHKHSPRASKPFIALNTAAIPKDLLESELFGHERGAFTGAQAVRKGRFEQAEGGTLFLDEIGDMPFDLQTRLLRVLSDGHFYRVGGHQPLKANVRLIAATHQNLEERVKAEVFREDLFHRLNVIRLRVPSLRERCDDVPVLAKHFLSESAKKIGCDAKRLSPDALQFISSLPFPGNVRQLENLCHWITVMAPSQIVEVSDLPPEFRGASGNSAPEFLKHVSQASNKIDIVKIQWTDLLRDQIASLLDSNIQDVMPSLLREFESALIMEALKHTRGRKNDAAIKLGIGRNTISRKMAELNIQSIDGELHNSKKDRFDYPSIKDEPTGN